MQLSTDLMISNRITSNLKTKSKISQALITVGQRNKNENISNNRFKDGSIYLMVNMAKDNTYGTSYKVSDILKLGSKAHHKSRLNVKIYDRRLKEGKLTLRFVEPEHDLFISNADPTQLETFVNVLKNAHNSESHYQQLSDLKPVSKNKIQKYSSTLYINNRQDYPTKEAGFSQCLKSLKIQNLQMKIIDLRICHLKHLMCLDLSGNVFKNIPIELLQLRSLKELNFSNNRITEIPHRFCENKHFCNQLLLLNLEGNRLSILPQNLTNFLNLVTLNLKDNFFSSLPCGLFQKMTKLRFLYLSGCKYLEKLPSTFFDTPRLDSLHADRLPKIFRRIDYRNYISNCHEDVICDTTTNIPSLLDISSGFILKHPLLWSKVQENENFIPSVIKQYLKTLVRCYCQSTCLPSSCLIKELRYRFEDAMKLVTRDIMADILNGTVNFECIFCSRKCKNDFMKSMNLSSN